MEKVMSWWRLFCKKSIWSMMIKMNLRSVAIRWVEGLLKLKTKAIEKQHRSNIYLWDDTTVLHLRSYRLRPSDQSGKRLIQEMLLCTNIQRRPVLLVHANIDNEDVGCISTSNKTTPERYNRFFFVCKS